MGAVTDRIRTLLLGEHDVRVLVEVRNPAAESVRLLATDSGLKWRLCSQTPGRSASSENNRSWTERLRHAWRQRTARPSEEESAIQELVEATGTAVGTRDAARAEVVSKVTARLAAAGIAGEVIGAMADTRAAHSVNRARVWPVRAKPTLPMRRRAVFALAGGTGVTVYGPEDQGELTRRFRCVSTVWDLDKQIHGRPAVPDTAERRLNSWRLICWLVFSLPFLVVMFLLGLTATPYFGARPPSGLAGLNDWSAELVWPWGLVCTLAWTLLLPWPFALLKRWRPVVLPAARCAVAAVVIVGAVSGFLWLAAWLNKVAPSVSGFAALAVAAVFGVIAVRHIPAGIWRRLAGWGLPLVLGGFTPFVGDLMQESYLGELGLRVQDVTVTGADRWLSGVICTGIALAGAYIVLSLWGLFRRLGAVKVTEFGGLQWVMLLCIGLVYLLTAVQAGMSVAANAAEAGEGRLPGWWPGVYPAWVCWRPTSADPIPFAGMGLPTQDRTVVWVGTADGRYALWSPQTQGVLVPDDVLLRTRSGPATCP